MKRVVSVSLGSPARDHAVTLRLRGEEIRVERRGVNGDLDAAVALLRALDGRVDAIGIGGIEFYLPIGPRRYHWRDAKRLRQAIRTSKVGDGNGLRALLARRTVSALERQLRAEGRTLAGMPALSTTAIARYALAEELVRAGCRLTCGDFMFALGLPIPLDSLGSVRTLGRILLPLVTQLPYRWLYTLGDAQLAPPVEKWASAYARATLIAGDFLQIRAHMPRDLRGKIILTNTTTPRDVDDLRARGVRLLVTETPRLEGRSFGANVIEALLLALTDKPPDRLDPADLDALADELGLLPSVEILAPAGDRVPDRKPEAAAGLRRTAITGGTG
ncbi:hypothetical protein [uncultured Amaricoccus sp.]|uniref:hypothetical protein n=1 Tax=uncultured Amaricoccus sp. TaxID=339341 RepID=UPI00260CFC64|nr:hypothetical protein [uncultured Amaricoccus sp.]